MFGRFLMLLALAWLVGCASSTGPVSGDCDLACQIRYSPFPNEEAEAMAMFLDSVIVASNATYEECAEAIGRFREQYSHFDTSWWVNPYNQGCCDSSRYWFNATKVEFPFPAYLGQVRLYFKDDAFGQAVLKGHYHYWDSLNRLFNLDTITVSRISYLNYIVARLVFKGRLNGKFLGEAYGKLPGVADADPGGFYIGDFSKLIPWRDEFGQICFLIDVGWGDCPAGCINHKYFYFKQILDPTNRKREFTLFGSFQNYINPPPPWWEEYKSILWKWYYY
jgi:hypothetical protein